MTHLWNVTLFGLILQTRILKALSNLDSAPGDGRKEAELCALQFVMLFSQLAHTNLEIDWIWGEMHDKTDSWLCSWYESAVDIYLMQLQNKIQASKKYVQIKLQFENL